MPRDFDPSELDLSSFDVVGEPDAVDQSIDPSQLDASNFEVISEPVHRRESGAALRLRQQAQREAEQQPDQSTYLERIALGTGQGFRGLESTVGGLFNLAGLTGIGRSIQGNARAGSANLADVSETLGGQNPSVSGDLLEQFSGMITQQFPAVAAAAITKNPRIAAAVAAGMGALQSAGSTQDSAEQAYEAQGMSPDEATARARIPSLLSGAITGVLTKYMPGKLGEGVTSTLSRRSVYNIAREVAHEIGLEATEEGLDQLGQAAVAKYSYDPDKPLNEILTDAWEAAGWGAGMAAGIGAVGTAAHAIADRAANRAPQQTGMSLRQPQAVPASQPAPEPIRNDNAGESPFYPIQDTSGMNLRGVGLTSLLPSDQLQIQSVEGERPGETIQRPEPVPRLEEIRQQTARDIASELNSAGMSPEMADQIGDAVSTIQRYNLTIPGFDPIGAALTELDRFGFRLPSVGKTQKERIQARSLAAEANRAALARLQKAAADSFPAFQAPTPIAGTPITDSAPAPVDEPAGEIRFPRDPNQFAAPAIRRNLEANMQSRSMDISMDDFTQPGEPHLQSVLGTDAPSWQQLAQSGVVQATPNQDGTVNVRVAPEALQKGGDQNETIQNETQKGQQEGLLSEPVGAAAEPGALVDEVKSQITPRGDTERATGYWKERFKKASTEQLIDLLKWTRGEQSTAWISRFIGDEAAHSLRERGVPVDSIRWQMETLSGLPPEPVIAQNAPAERGLRAPQSEMPFADNAFALAPETTQDGGRIMRQQAQLEADQAANAANQNQMFEPSVVPTVQPPVVEENLTPEPVKSDAVRQYEGERAGFNQARRDFQKARRLYKDRKINEKSFLAASKSFDQAQSKMDRAERAYQKSVRESEQGAQSTRKASAQNYVHPPDILTDIEEHVGKIRKIKPGETSPVADLWRAAQKAEPELFAEGSTYDAPDQAAETLGNATGRSVDYEKMLQDIIQAGPRRAAAKAAFFREIRHMKEDARVAAMEARQKENFNKVVTSGKSRSNSKTIAADQLQSGDKFSVEGHRFTVEQVKVRSDDETLIESIRLKDDKKFGTQEVGPDAALEIDKRSLKKAAGQSDGPTDAFRRGSQPRQAPRNGGQSDVTPTDPNVNPAFSIQPSPKGLSSVEPGPDQQQRINAGVGLEGAREAIGRSNLTPQHKRATLSALDALEKSGLNAQKIWLEIRTYLEGREAGSVSYHPTLGAIIRIMESSRPEVGPHEVFHILIHALPEQYRAALEAERVANLPANAPESIRSGNMTSLQFRDAGLPIDLYPFINVDEYGAYVFGNKAAQSALETRAPGIVARLKEWFAQVWEQLKSLAKDPVASESIFKAMMNGTQQYDAARAARYGMERSTFVTSTEESINAANLASNAIEQQIEGESQLAQAADVTDVLDQFGVNNAGHLVKQAFDYGNWEGIRNTGEVLNQNRESYQQMKARLAGDPYRRARLAGEAGQSMIRFGEILDQVLNDSAKAFTKLNSRHFQDFIARVQAKSAEAQAAQAILTTSKSVFDSAIKEASAALKQEARTDRDIAVLEGEIRGIREAAESTVAMEQTLNDMVATLASTPEGQAALFTGEGGGRKVIEIYRDLKRSTRQPVVNENLLKWAGYILAKSPKLAAKIQAANLAKQTGMRAQLNGMARQLANDFTKDPVATVRRAVRDRERKVRDAMSAEFAFKQLEEDMLSELEPLIASVDAGGIAAKIKADPQFQSLRREILNDQTSWGGSPDPSKALRSAEDAGSTITLPVVQGPPGAPPHPLSGATVGIGHEVIDGNLNTLRKRWDEQRQATDFLEDWLANPINADDPMRRYHAHNLETLKNYYAGQQHLIPENQSPLWNRAYSIIGSAVSKSGSRLVGQARSALNRADQMHKWSRDWFERTVHSLPHTQRAAITSHGIKWNNLRGRSIVEANKIYQRKVGQELAASWQRQQGGYNVGDTLSSGEVVTREDMAHLEAQSKAGWDALNLAAKYDEQITKDTRGLKKTSNYRSALRTSPYLLPRMFDYTLQAKAKAVGDAVKGGDAAAIEAAMSALWPDIGHSLLADRNPEFAKKTIFDGKGGAFEAVSNMMQGNPAVVPTIDALAGELAANSTMTKDKAKEIVLGEFGRIVSNWSSAVEEKVAAAEQGGKAGEAKNSFTQARGDALAPWTFYKTGFTTTDDITNHAAGMQSVAVDRVIASLEAIQKDLDRQQNDLTSKAMEFERQGKLNATKSAIELQAIERRRGQTYDSWENLKERKTNIAGVLAQLQQPSVSSTDFDLLFNRGAGALVGSLIGNVVTTMKNISSIFLGRQLRAAGMNEFNSTLRSMLFTKAEAAKILLSFGAVGVPKSLGYLLRGMARGVPQLMKGNAREAYVSALRDVIRELSVNVPRRLKSVRELEAAGLYSLPDAVAKFDNQILGSILYRGGIPANEFQGAAKIGGYTAGLFEATLLAVANAGFPTIGDAAINGAMHNAVNSQWGPVQGMQDSLRKVFNNWKNGGLPRTFNLTDSNDPVNRLTPKELGLTEHTLSQLRRTYQMAGMSFDERAAAYLAELQTNPNAQFLTTENRNALTETLINKMNRGTFSNAPLKFKDGSFLSNMVRPLYGWSLRSFADWEESMAIPTNTESGRMKLWATSMVLAGVALAMTGAGGQLQDELMARMLKRGLYNIESQNRLPWEEPTIGRKIANTMRLGMESVPLLGILGNLLIPANSPARASFEPTLALWESGKSIAGWIQGMISSGDPLFGLADMAAKFIPDSRIVLNRLESQEGRRLGNNAVADIKRFADPDLVRPAYKGAVASGIDEATPWKQRMDNAAMRRDAEGFRRAANEAVQANLRMGKKPQDARKAVQSYWRSRNPETRALTRRMTGSEERAMMERAASVGKNLAAEIQEANQNWAQAGAMIGVRQRAGGTNRVNLRAPSLSARGGSARY